LSIATNIGLLKNVHHANNTQFAPNTHTTKRLASYGIVTREQIDNYVNRCKKTTGIDCSSVIENGSCKLLQEIGSDSGMANRFRWWDTCHPKQCMYELLGVDLRVYTTHEIHSVMDVKRPTWTFPSQSDDNDIDLLEDVSNLKWWIDNFDINSLRDVRYSLTSKKGSVF